MTKFKIIIVSLIAIILLIFACSFTRPKPYRTFQVEFIGRDYGMECFQVRVHNNVHYVVVSKQGMCTLK